MAVSRSQCYLPTGDTIQDIINAASVSGDISTEVCITKKVKAPAGYNLTFEINTGKVFVFQTV